MADENSSNTPPPASDGIPSASEFLARHLERHYQDYPLRHIRAIERVAKAEGWGVEKIPTMVAELADSMRPAKKEKRDKGNDSGPYATAQSKQVITPSNAGGAPIGYGRFNPNPGVGIDLFEADPDVVAAMTGEQIHNALQARRRSQSSTWNPYAERTRKFPLRHERGR